MPTEMSSWPMFRQVLRRRALMDSMMQKTEWTFLRPFAWMEANRLWRRALDVAAASRKPLAGLGGSSRPRHCCRRLTFVPTPLSSEPLGL